MDVKSKLYNEQPIALRSCRSRSQTLQQLIYNTIIVPNNSLINSY